MADCSRLNLLLVATLVLACHPGSGASKSAARRSSTRRSLKSDHRHLQQSTPTGGYLWANGYVYKQYTIPDSATTGVVAVSSGGSNAMALLSNGSVAGWGSSVTRGQTVFNPPAGTTVKSMACGSRKTLALLSSGAVTYIDPVDGITIPAQANSGVVDLAAGANTVIAVLNDGSVVNWGVKNFEKYQVLTPGASDVAKVSIGSRREAATFTIFDNFAGTSSAGQSLVDIDNVMLLSKSGAVKVYGMSRYNQSQVPAEAASGVQAIAAGGGHCVALITGGKVVVWGANDFNQTVVPAEAQSGVTAIAAGQDHTLALVNGRTLCWGANNKDQCNVPSEAQSGVKAIAAGSSNSVAVLSNSSILIWGEVKPYDMPVIVPNILRSGSGVIAVAAGTDHDVVLLSDSTVIAFGDNREGQSSVPSQLVQTGGVRAIAAGDAHSLALLYTGVVVSWGEAGALVPTSVTGVEAIAAGRSRTCVVLSSDKSIQCFGNDFGLNTSLIQGVRAKKIDMKWGTALALLEDGSVINFGYGSDVNPSPKEAQANVVDIAAGSVQGLALLADNSVVGFSTRGEAGEKAAIIPADFQKNASSVAAGVYTSMVVRKDGRATIWGSVCDSEKCKPPPPGVLRMAGGSNHYLAVIDQASQAPSAGPAASTTPGAVTPGTTPTTPAAAPISDSRQISSGAPAPGSSSSSSSSGKTIGIAVGVAGGVVLLALLAGLLLWRSKKSSPGQAKTSMSSESGFKSPSMGANASSAAHVLATNDAAEALNLKGLAKGELFAKTTAHEYTWSAVTADGPDLQCVEAGINEVLLDKMLEGSADRSTASCPVVQLTGKELKEQVHLLKDGLLGKGATAVVFKALWPSRFGPNAVLAVKVLKDGHDYDAVDLQNFSYEAGVLSSTRHPNVVRIYGYCMEPPTVCLVLEVLQHSLGDLLYLPTNTGHDAVAVINNTVNDTTSETHSEDASQLAAGPRSALTPQNTEPGVPALSMFRVLEISADIAAGLAYLHDTPLNDTTTKSMKMFGLFEELTPVISGAEGLPAAGLEQPGRQARIVHRDLKPANILLNSVGQAKISDFGLAREHKQTTVQTENVGAGTLPYMAPEVLISSYGTYKCSITNKVDIYSTAMILYEMVAHEMAWKGMANMAILAAVTGGRRPDLPADKPADEANPQPLTREALSQLPATVNAMPAFNAIIRACWHQRDSKRPTAATLHAMLVKLLQLPDADPSKP